MVDRRTGLEPRDKELQIGGVIYSDSADKAARFVEICNQKKIPLLFLQDVTGFMVGSRSERGGIIKDGAKMVNAVANSVVPKITVFVGNSYGAGNYAMCGKAYGARFLFAWPSASIAVMGGEQASRTLLAIQLKNRGEEVSEEEKKERLADIQKRYADAMNPRYAAARLWVDAIIDPRRTREVVAQRARCLRQQPRRPRVQDRRAADLRLTRAGELEVEEGAGGAPVALDGAARDIGRLGDLGEGETAEEVPFDGLREARRGALEPRECVVQSEQVLDRRRRCRRRHLNRLEVDIGLAAAALRGFAPAGVIDHDLAHGARGDGEEVGTVLVGQVAPFGDAQESFVDERSRRGPGIARAAHVAPGERAKIRIDDLEELRRRLRVALARGGQQARDGAVDNRTGGR